jgi:hypothetical protein
MADYLSKLSSVSIPSGQDAIDALQTSSLNNISGIPGNPFSGGNPLKSLGPTVTNLTNDAKNSAQAIATGMSIPGVDATGAMQTVVVPGTRPTRDFRIRLAPKVNANLAVYGANDDSNILNPLRGTQGMMFPFTPTIDWAQSVQYKTTSLVHSNQDYLSYENTPSTNISISGTFVIQNEKEAKYMLACIHFLRVVSKSYFGKASFKEPSSGEPSLAGLPPPVLTLNGYGDYMFNDLPVIVKDHNYTFKPDVSYIDFTVNGSPIRLPAIMDISVKLVVQNTPKRLKDKFDLDKFRTGELMKSKGWI